MGRGRALAKCHVAVAGQYREYPYAKVSGWISNLGGNASTTVTMSTTHVVATDKAWKRKDPAVAAALKSNEEDDADIKIVNFDWLEDSVNTRSKKRENPYLWEKLDAAITKQNAAKLREEKANAKKHKRHVGLMAELFDDSTDMFVDPKEKRRIQKQIEEERRVKESLAEEALQEKKERERRERAEIMGHGAKKARNDIFTGKRDPQLSS